MQWVAATMCALTGLFLANAANAAFVATAVETGGDVVVTGSGTINLAAWAFAGSPPVGSGISADNFNLVMGTSPSVTDQYSSPTNFSGPTSVGPGNGGFNGASMSSGDVIVMQGSGGLFVPTGYTSGGSLSSSIVIGSSTFASLGMNLGSYTWTWGSGASTASDFGTANT